MSSLTHLPYPNYHRNLSSFPAPISRHSVVNLRKFQFRCSIANRDSATTPSISDNTSNSHQPLLDCVIVGGGISGLCIAQALATKHEGVSDLIVTEARDRVGGNISTVEKDGYLWEEGPNSFQPSDAMLTMVVDCGLKDELVLGDPTAPRFVLWDGDLKPVPSSPSDFPTFDLMSLSGKLRAGFGALGIRPPPPDHEESIEEFVRRNLGDEVFERLIEPFCSGVYAGDPSKLSMKAAFGKVWKLEQNGGSIIGGALKALQKKNKSKKIPRDPRLPTPKGQTVGSFRKGQAMLPNAISKGLGSRVKLSWKLKSISKLDNKGYSLTYETPNGSEIVLTKTVIMTIPSYVASDLLRPLSMEAADALSQFYYPPVAAVSVSYPKEAIRSDRLIDGQLKGFGQLHPRSQGVETLGTIYSSSLFPNRAPPGRVLLLNYIGGATNPGIISKTEGQLVEAVDRDLRKMLINPKAGEPLTLGVKVWPRAIPQFLIGHYDNLEQAKCSLSMGGFRGLFLGGNYVSGVALGRCVENAYEVAADVSKFLSQGVYK
ncbi:protoporphyrinogen oxidase 1, chloroplastic [Rutidosis leptorrhynchoides]|uniref:protoporphyrinogen oxidase 1, chloroplastic n=1 Tax=Rutidosis leptorrhynchoides TaxID=125765 RepID=UPI003A99D336